MPAKPRVRLVYLDESTHNPTYFSWDAKDTAGRHNHGTYRNETLAISDPDDFWVERDGVGSVPAPTARDQIIELTADFFDATLLRTVDPCFCGFINDPALDRLHCLDCGEQVRDLRFVSVEKITTEIPIWLAERPLHVLAAGR